MLEVNKLNIEFKTPDGISKVLDNISFSLKKGEILGIAGESGSGKSQTVLAIMGLLSRKANVSGSICFMGEELLNMPEKKLNTLRGNQISMIFQDPMTSLNPYLTIASQMTEVLMLHKGDTYQEALKKSIDFLELTRIPDAKTRIHFYPHEFSGGMRQRVMIAMALLCRPQLLIADEPTTALDVTMQAQILKILKDLQKEFDMSILIISHDMGVMANLCDRVAIFYAGNLMESGTVDEIFYSPQHPYTQALLSAIPHNKSAPFVSIPGEPPNLFTLPEGCVFQERCSKVHDACRHQKIETYFLNPQDKQRVLKCNLFEKSNEK